MLSLPAERVVILLDNVWDSRLQIVIYNEKKETNREIEREFWQNDLLEEFELLETSF